jgi:CubicO group peptidase (beta-lactamase class C family)
MSGFFFAKADNQTQNREVEMSEAKDKIVLPTTSTTTYPGTTWQKVTAAEQGFDATKLEAIKNLMQQYKANGVLVRNGYLIDSWNYAGQPDTQFDIQSCTKTITSLALGLALAEGRIAAIDRPVKEYWPDFDAGPYTEKITFQNLFSKRAAFLLKLRESMQVPDMLRE